MAVSYSNRIRSLRKKLKMTQKQMAEQLFIDQSTLATYENGTREIPIDILVKLSKNLRNFRGLSALRKRLCRAGRCARPHPDKGTYRQPERNAGV